jgi:hypothetical protein
MKLILLTPALAAILGLALAGVPLTVQAETNAAPAPVATTAPTPAAKPAKPKKIAYDGTLTAIDPTAGTITVTTKKSSKTLTIASTTKIKKDKKTATLADFAVGAKVTGSYTAEASGKLTASSLYTKTMTAAAKPATKPAVPPAPASPAATPVTNPAPAAQ